MIKKSTVLLVFAFVIGISIGSYDRFPERQPTGFEERSSVDDGSKTSAASSAQVRSVNPAPDSSEPGRTAVVNVYDDVVFAEGGLSLVAHRSSGEFVGYQVVNAGEDRRLAEGDVITAINGTPVEDSAAGSELLLIGLASEDAEIQTWSASSD